MISLLVQEIELPQVIENADTAEAAIEIAIGAGALVQKIVEGTAEVVVVIESIGMGEMEEIINLGKAGRELPQQTERDAITKIREEIKMVLEPEFKLQVRLM